MSHELRRINSLKELLVLIRRSFLVLVYDRRGFVLSILFPIGASIVTVFIAGKDMFVNYEGTRSACFVFCCAAIWGGLFNSIQIIAKERDSIRRDYAAGLRLGCYTLSKAVVQAVLCLLQSLCLTCGLFSIHLIYGNELPKSGLVFPDVLVEYNISMFFLMFAADGMGLFISCLVRKVETASIIAPYILILQLIFSGILFTMDGISQILSYSMLSRWGMEALGSISDLNSIPLKISEQFSMIPHEAEEMFMYSDQHLIVSWLVLATFAIGFILVGNLVLHRISKDSR